MYKHYAIRFLLLASFLLVTSVSHAEEGKVITTHFGVWKSNEILDGDKPGCSVSAVTEANLGTIILGTNKAHPSMMYFVMQNKEWKLPEGNTEPGYFMFDADENNQIGFTMTSKGPRLVSEMSGDLLKRVVNGMTFSMNMSIGYGTAGSWWAVNMLGFVPALRSMGQCLDKLGIQGVPLPFKPTP